MCACQNARQSNKIGEVVHCRHQSFSLPGCLRGCCGSTLLHGLVQLPVSLGHAEAGNGPGLDILLGLSTEVMDEVF